jgi:hypothetical protein
VSATEDEKRRVAAIEADYPGSQVWVGPASSRWSWRLIADADGPGEIITRDDEAQLRTAVDEWLREHAERADPATQAVVDTCIEALRVANQDGRP